MDSENDDEDAAALGWTNIWEEDMGACGGGALSPMSRLATLLAVDAIALAGDRSNDVGGDTSCTGEIRPAAAVAAADDAALAASAAAPLFLLKLSLHFDGFLVTGAGGAMGATVAAGADAGAAAARERRAAGTGYMDTGS